MYTNTNWIDLIDNQQSINSLYKTAPCLERITIKTIDFCTWSQDRICLGFVIDQMPDIIPQRGLWRSCRQTNGVYMSLSFSNVENFFVKDFDLSSSYYSLDIRANPKFVYRCITIDNVPVIDRTDRLQVELSNTSSQISFVAFIIRVDSIRPVGYNHNNDIRKPIDTDSQNLWKK